jgi:hypothetical protein
MIAGLSASSHGFDIEPMIAGDVFSDPGELATRIISNVQVATNVREDVVPPRTFVSKDRHPAVLAKRISEHWGIGVAQAQKQ